MSYMLFPVAKTDLYLVEAGRQGGAAATAYSAVKMAHFGHSFHLLSTRAGLHPFGRWDYRYLGPSYQPSAEFITRAVAAREQSDPAALFAEFLQEACVLVRGCRGRAALQRRADAALAQAPSESAAAAAVGLASWTVSDWLRGLARPVSLACINHPPLQPLADQAVGLSSDLHVMRHGLL